MTKSVGLSLATDSERYEDVPLDHVRVYARDDEWLVVPSAYAEDVKRVQKWPPVFRALLGPSCDGVGNPVVGQVMEFHPR